MSEQVKSQVERRYKMPAQKVSKFATFLEQTYLQTCEYII